MNKMELADGSTMNTEFEYRIGEQIMVDSDHYEECFQKEIRDGILWQYFRKAE